MITSPNIQSIQQHQGKLLLNPIILLLLRHPPVLRRRLLRHGRRAAQRARGRVSLQPALHAAAVERVGARGQLAALLPLGRELREADAALAGARRRAEEPAAALHRGGVGAARGEDLEVLVEEAEGEDG